MIRIPLPRRLALAPLAVAIPIPILFVFAALPVPSRAQDAPAAPSPPKSAPQPEPAEPAPEPAPAPSPAPDAPAPQPDAQPKTESSPKPESKPETESDPEAAPSSDPQADSRLAGFQEPSLEPAALELLDKMGKAYRRLAHYSAEWEVTFLEDGARPLRSTTRIAYSKPNRFSIARGHLQFVNDSKRISWAARGNLETKAASGPPSLSQLREKPVGSAMMDGPAELAVQLLLADDPREAILVKVLDKRVVGLKLDRPVERNGRLHPCLRLLLPLARDLRALVDPSTFRIVAFQRVHDLGDSWSASNPGPFRYRLVRESLKPIPASAFVMAQGGLTKAADLESGLIQPDEAGKPFQFSLVNEAAPVLNLQILDEQDQPSPLDPESLKGATLILCFWKAADEASFAQLKSLEKPLDEWNKRKAGVKLFAVNVGDENTEALDIVNSLSDRDVTVAARENGEIALDRKAELAGLLGVGDALPAIIVINPAGQIRIRQIGYRLRAADRLGKEIDRLLP